MVEAMALRVRGGAAARARAPPDAQPVAVPARRYECGSCMDIMDPSKMNFLTAPCGDTYCGTCVVFLFTRSLTDETLFPPRCCNQPIPAEESRVFLEAELLKRFLAKMVEFENPNPTHCHRSKCAAFIPPKFVRDDIGTCVRCQEQTCAFCKDSAHSGDCPQDTATQELLVFAKTVGWQRCTSCRRLVDLVSGCNHISEPPLFFPFFPSSYVLQDSGFFILTSVVPVCRCSAEFCYICAARWKTCRCATWTEERLTERRGPARANGLDAAGAGANAAQNAAARAERFPILERFRVAVGAMGLQRVVLPEAGMPLRPGPVVHVPIVVGDVVVNAPVVDAGRFQGPTFDVPAPVEEDPDNEHSRNAERNLRIYQQYLLANRAQRHVPVVEVSVVEVPVPT